MWNTNVELEQRISALEKKLIQNNEPNTWKYKWQVWFDEVLWILKFWDWTKYTSWSTINGKRWTWNRNATGNYSITWLWFKPKVIYFSAWINWLNLWWSDWSWDDTSYSCRYQYLNAWVMNTNTIWNLAYCYNPVWWTVSACNLVSLDSDWFTINVLNVWAWQLEFKWIAVW